MDISTREIASKKVSGNKVDFPTIEITSKKVRGKNVNISTIRITSKKVHGNDVEIRRIWSSTYRLNIDVESTSIWRGVADELA